MGNMGSNTGMSDSRVHFLSDMMKTCLFKLRNINNSNKKNEIKTSFKERATGVPGWLEG